MRRNYITQTLQDLESWLRQQNPEGEYDWSNVENCLMHQFLKASGVDIMCFGAKSGYLTTLERVDVPREWTDIAIGDPMTYGAALERCRGVLRQPAAVDTGALTA